MYSASPCLNLGANFNLNDKSSSNYWDMGPVGAQFILFTSLQKLDQAKRSRGGIRLRRGLLIAVTALKAKQLLWSQQDQNTYTHQHVETSPDQLFYTNLTKSVGDNYQCIDEVPIPMGSIQTDINPLLHTSGHIKNELSPNNEIQSSTSGSGGYPFFPPTSDEYLQSDHLFYTSSSPPSSKRLRIDHAGVDDANNYLPL